MYGVSRFELSRWGVREWTMTALALVVVFTVLLLGGRGLAAAAGGLMRLPRLLPQRIAMEMALTGDMYGAEQLAAYGLFNAVVEPGEALHEARQLARRIMANAPLSVAASKRVIMEQRDWPISEMFEHQDPITAPVLASQDAREGAAAFAERRPPQWRGQ